MRRATYAALITAAGLAGALAGAALGLAAVPLLRWLMNDGDRIEWEGVE